MAESISDKGQCDTLPALLAYNVKNFGNQPAYREKEYGIWQSWTWAEAGAEIRNLSLGLLSIGVKTGDYIAIIGRNRPHLYWAMLAAQEVRAIPVPVYQDSVADEIAYVLEHCEAKFVFAENQEQVDKVLDIKDKLPNLEAILFLDPRGMRKYDRTHLHDYREIQLEGQKAPAKLVKERDKRLQEQSGRDSCAMLYTSGTTGRPKGVVLSNDNIIKTSQASCEFDGLKSTDSVLAYLPMAWVGDFIFSIGQATWTGFCVCCPENTETMQHDLKEIGPSYFFAPPRHFEGVLTDVMIRMEDAGFVQRHLFNSFMGKQKPVFSSPSNQMVRCAAILLVCPHPVLSYELMIRGRFFIARLVFLLNISKILRAQKTQRIKRAGLRQVTQALLKMKAGIYGLLTVLKMSAK